jgi:SAM-dependent methyltransferase
MKSIVSLPLSEVNGISLPPQEFMDAVAGMATTEIMHIVVGQKVCETAIKQCRILQTDSILDIGSGCGRVASHFVGKVAGEYHGLEILLPMVEWCRKNISSRHSNFHFHHADLSNTLYRREGADAGTYVFPFPSDKFDVVLAASVFTHLVPASARQYAREIFRVLRPNGRALLTFMLVNDNWRRKVEMGERFIVDFAHSGDGYLTADPDNPESVIAFEQDDAIRMLTDARLVIEAISLGTWSGNPGWIGQDSILVSKR